MKFVTEVDALRAVENALRAALQWQWEDGADEDCAKDMQAVRRAVDDLDTIRRLLGSGRDTSAQPSP